MTKDKATKKSTKPTRTRNWTFLVYPDSAPANWRDVIDDLHIQWVESPLHDKDLNADGSTKKPHWHILLMYEGVKSYNQIKDITTKLNATIPQVVHSNKGLTRYMAHLDNPDKHQYNANDIVSHGGADLAELLKPTSSDRYNLIKEMIQYVQDNEITEISDLIVYASAERFDDWFPLLCDNSAYILDSFIRSIRHKIKDQQFTKKSKTENSSIVSVDTDTGEILE